MFYDMRIHAYLYANLYFIKRNNQVVESVELKWSLILYILGRDPVLLRIQELAELIPE